MALRAAPIDIATRRHDRRTEADELRIEIASRNAEALEFVSDVIRRAFCIGEAAYQDQGYRALQLCRDLQVAAKDYRDKWSEAGA